MNSIYLLTIKNLRMYSHNFIMRTIMFFAILSIFLGHILVDLDTSNTYKFTSVFGLLVINTFLAFVTIYLGSNSIYKDIKNSILYIMISSCVTRREILVAKYVALLCMNIVNILIMFVFFILLLFLGGDYSNKYLVAIYMVFMELALLSAIVVFFNTFTNNVVTFYCSSILYIAGHYTGILLKLPETLGYDILHYLGTPLFYLLPNFNFFSNSEFIVNSEFLPTGILMPATIYTITYSIITLALGWYIFKRRGI